MLKPRRIKSQRNPQEVPNRFRHALQGLADRGLYGVPDWVLWVPPDICKDTKASAACTKLTDAGLSDRYLGRVLWQIKDESTFVGSPTRSKAPPWSVPDGLTLERLRRIPKLIQELAKGIEKINSHSLYVPTEQVLRSASVSPLGLGGRPSEVFSRLPWVLDGYARFLEIRAKQVGKLRKGFAKGTESEFRLKQQVIDFIAVVIGVTGQRSWTSLADLLSALLPDRAWVSTAEQLRIFYRRSRRFATLEEQANSNPVPRHHFPYKR